MVIKYKTIIIYIKYRIQKIHAIDIKYLTLY